MLIFMQKSFKFCIPRLKTPQPVLPYPVQTRDKLCAIKDRNGHSHFFDLLTTNYTQWVQILTEVVRTPGPRIMQNHLVRYSTSAKNPQIFT